MEPQRRFIRIFCLVDAKLCCRRMHQLKSAWELGTHGPTRANSRGLLSITLRADPDSGFLGVRSANCLCIVPVSARGSASPAPSTGVGGRDGKTRRPLDGFPPPTASFLRPPEADNSSATNPRSR